MVDVYNLGAVTWVESQSLYHALAYLNREGLIICYPTSPYVCLGLHDDLEQEIDWKYCRDQGIPLLRRETGGGVVYLDSRQIFFQLVLRRDNPLVPLCRPLFFQRFLRPAISVCKDLGLPAAIKAPADIVVAGRKCSGNGAGDIGQCVAYVGNILLDFEFEIMSRVLRVPGAVFRQQLEKAMRRYMTTLGEWLGRSPGYAELSQALAVAFGRELGELRPRQPDADLMNCAHKVGARLVSPEWLGAPGRRSRKRRVKIAEGIYLLEARLAGGRPAVVLVKDGLVEEVSLACGQVDTWADGQAGSQNQSWGSELERYVGRPWREGEEWLAYSQ